MAAFYQDPNPTSDPNYTGASKEPSRVQADTSMGTLFSGIGDVSNVAGKALNTIFDTKIKDDARALTDPIQNEHGGNIDVETAKQIAGLGSKGKVRALQMQNGGAATDGDNTTGPLGFAPTDAANPELVAGGIFGPQTVHDQPESKPLPSGAQQEISQLNRFDQAYKAGNLSDSAYDAQLIAVRRQLVNKYPGFNDEVDTAISQLTGVQPANAIRASLQRDIQYNQLAQLQGATADQKYRDTNAGEINALGYNDKTPIEVVRAGVQEWKGQKAILESKALSASVGSPEAEAALSDTVGATVRTSLIARGNAAQGNKTLADYTADAQKMSQDPTSRTPKAIDELVNQMTLARNGVAAQIQQDIYKPIPGDPNGHSLVSKIKDGDAKVPQILAAQLKPWDDAIAFAKSGNFSGLQQSTDALKYQSNIDVQNFYRAFPQARVAAAVNKAFENNPAMSNRLVELDKTLMPNWQKAITNGLTNAIVGGSDATPAPTPSQALNSYGPDGKLTTPAAKSVVKQYDIVISPDNTDRANSTHVAKQFFGDQAFYDNLNDSGRLKLFMTMANPAKTAFIQKLAANDPDVEGQYTNWVKYAAGDIWRRNSDDLQATLQSKTYDVQYNANIGLFEDKTKYIGNADVNRAVVSRQLGAVNNAITILKPIVGNKPEEIFQALGIDPHAEKQDGLIKRVFDAMGDKIQDWRTSGEREDIKAGTKSVGKQSLDQTDEGLRSTVASAESNGDYNSVFGLGADKSRDLSGNTVGEIMAMQKHYTDNGSPSSAVGKYQVLRKTMASLVKDGAISSDEKFTPDLQERIFTALAKRRGMDKYLSGDMDEGTFAQNLSQEWAGLPSNSGKSFYAGDGLNASNAKLPDLLKSIRSLKG